ncbi:MAG: pitrilysin family protein, partial [Nanoarchaeota archaeon]
MQKVVLPNGLTIIYEARKSKSIVVEVLTKVGSNQEKPTERGISHFIEHITFEGTAKRPTNQLISNEIERVGGDFNAYTTNERTCFYVKVLKKHFPLAVEILADILQNSLFNKKEIEKEKRVVLKEIDLVNDEPKFYQWILLQKNLFQKHPVRYPTYGSKEVIKNLSRDKLLKYFHQHYVPANMVISIVGEV